MADRIQLGAKVKCQVTGFSGVATKRMEVLHGSTQVHVEGFDSGYRRDEWIEEGRLSIADQKPVSAVSVLQRPPPKEG